MSAILPLNSGEARLVVELGTPAEYACDAGFNSAIHLFGRHWDGDRTFPFSTSVEGLWLRTADLAVLRDHIVHWSSRPLEQLVVEDLTADFELAHLPGQSVHLCFGPRSDTSSDLNPVISIAFLAGAMHGEFHFVTDQSCLTLFPQELSDDLAKSPESAL